MNKKSKMKEEKDIQKILHKASDTDLNKLYHKGIYEGLSIAMEIMENENYKSNWRKIHENELDIVTQ